MSNTAETRVDVPIIVTAGRSLALALVEYRAKPTNPERLWNFQEAHWNLNRFAMGLSPRDVKVLDCPYTEAQMKKFMGAKRFSRVSYPDFALFLPEVASTAPEGLRLLGKAYPKMGWDEADIAGVSNINRKGNPVVQFGWIRTEKSIDAPHTQTDEDAAEKAIEEGRIGQTLNIYVEAGNQSKLLTGEYLDEKRTYVRVLNARIRARVVDAHFLGGGRCYVGWGLGPGCVYGGLGVRSVGV